MDYAITERPETLEQFVGSPWIMERIASFFTNGNLPNKILFTGSSGTGKTTLCGIIKNHLKVNETFNLHYVDCGAQKDIATARETVHKVSQQAFGGDSQNVLIVLEEAHKLNKACQETWLATLESLKPNQYVIATTDQPDAFLNTFRSRFMELHLSTLTKEEIVKSLLMPVVRKYKIKVRVSTLDKIAELCHGNNRTALSMLNTIADLSPDKHDEALTPYATAEADSLYKAINILIYGEFFDKYKDYTKVMDIMVKCGKEPEAIRQCILLKCAELLKKPKNISEIMRASMLTQVLSDVVCYGEIGWAVLGKNIFEFFLNFFSEEP